MQKVLTLAVIALLAPLMAFAQAATLYRTPYCGCCLGHADYLRAQGYEITVVEMQAEALAAFKQDKAIPLRDQGCHTLMIEGYAVEGHVPAEAIEALLAKRPDITGIALPGMPAGSPGMGGQKAAPFQVLIIGSDGRIFMEV